MLVEPTLTDKLVSASGANAHRQVGYSVCGTNAHRHQLVIVLVEPRLTDKLVSASGAKAHRQVG